MATILEKIVEHTADDLTKRKKKISFKDLESLEQYESPKRSLADALKRPDEISVIAEIKKASPSKGVIREPFDPVDLAIQYQEGGAAAISVLTDEPAFQGKLEYLEMVANVSTVPLLRKDFIIDPYQVKEARAYGADAVLLIVAITTGSQLQELLHAAVEFELDSLVEVYSEKDLAQVEEVNNLVKIIGANNRDLHHFEVDLHRGIRLLKKSRKEKITVSESGISHYEDLKLLHKEGIDAVLIGEHLMRQEYPGKALEKLLTASKERIAG